MGRVKVGKGETWEQIAERTSGKTSLDSIVAANPGAAKDNAPDEGATVNVPGYGMENDNDTENDVDGIGKGTAFDPDAKKDADAAKKKTDTFDTN